MVASTTNAHVEVTKEFWQPALMHHIKNVTAFNDKGKVYCDLVVAFHLEVFIFELIFLLNRLGAECVKGLYFVSLFTLGKGVLIKGQ